MQAPVGKSANRRKASYELHLNVQRPLIEEGFGDEQTLDANLIVARMVVLCRTIRLAGGTFSVENPCHSFL